MKTLQAVLLSFFLAAACVTGQPAVSTDKTVYLVLEPIVVNFSGLPGASNDWVTVVAASAPDAAYEWWTYLGGRTSGSVTVNNTFPPGAYEARIHVQDSPAVAARARFTINYPATTVATGKTSYLVLQPVVVSYANMPGYASDWVTIVPAGASDKHLLGMV